MGSPHYNASPMIEDLLPCRRATLAVLVLLAVALADLATIVVPAAGQQGAAPQTREACARRMAPPRW